MYTSGTTRVTGLSGIDTESMVEQLMYAESSTLFRYQRDVQWKTWQQESYREVITKIQDFQNKWFSSGNMATNLKYSKAFNKFTNSVKGADGKENNAITVNSSSKDVNYEIEVKQLAMYDTYVSTKSVNSRLVSKGDFSDIYLNSIKNAISENGSLDYTFTLDGVAKNIKLDASDFSNVSAMTEDEFVSVLNNKLTEKFGVQNGLSKVLAKITSSGELEFSTISGHSLKMESGSGSQASLSLASVTDEQKSKGEIKFSLNIDGTEYDVSIAENNDSEASIETRLKNAKVTIGGKEAAVSNYVKISVNGAGELVFAATQNGSKSNIEVSNFTVGGVNLGTASLAATATDATLGIKSGNSNSLNTSATMEEFLGDDFWTANGSDTASFKINDVEIEFTKDTNFATFMNKLNKSTANVTLGYNSTTEAFMLKANDGGTVNNISFGNDSATNAVLNALGISYGGNTIGTDVALASGTSTKLGDLISDSDFWSATGSATVNLNGVQLNVNKSMTVNTFMNLVNGTAVPGVSMSYANGSFSLTDSSGNAVEIGTDAASTGFFKSFGFDSERMNKSHSGGQDAILIIDGQYTTRTTNDIELDGLKITLNKTTEEGNPVKIESTTDVDGIYSMLEEFIKDYNELIADLNKRTSETRAKSSTGDYYEPLTDMERDEMDADEIEKWEAKAKTGLLNRDDSINSFLSKMRGAFYQSLKLEDGSVAALYNMGITTSSSYSDKGKLVIDEEKLKEAIRTNSAGIQELFTSLLSDDIDKYCEYMIGTKGVLREKAGIEGTASANENTLSEQISDLNDRIKAEKNKLTTKEENYYSMFSTMESTMNQMDTQLASLQSMLGGA